MNKFPVLEIFGPTIQGEGMVVGRKTMFVRTAGCDYSCAWCDSAFTWDGSAKDEIQKLTAPEIINALEKNGGDCFDHVTISGGNPALLKHLNELIDRLHDKGCEVALETQGSKWQEWFLTIDDLTISPKPPSSGMSTNWEVLDGIIAKLEGAGRTSHTSLKVVIFNEEDLEYAKYVHKRYPNLAFFVQVGNEALDESDDQNLALHLLNQYEWLIDRVMHSRELNHVRVLPQVHALLWGNRRGV
ncbi:7-carboxy-7-deazaguanine synthase QueE [Pontibacillus yanchengensis]|uniref:7-carboxy-7-deazaguanine synthase n=1 Tax=Pontibacillus yanchengensis Y32 TaxID=1385514 RepID=A0A0A2TRY3_9BACI|nr:7-carboxy-7-deazaguanine synthase QueE [Pontibacillus yanchengensis]KGP72020.1 7-carboxy-7-deazaguanine synthase [Pontibacillus yanchengensis Y32]